MGGSCWAEEVEKDDAMVGGWGTLGNAFGIRTTNTCLKRTDTTAERRDRHLVALPRVLGWVIIDAIPGIILARSAVVDVGVVSLNHRHRR